MTMDMSSHIEFDRDLIKYTSIKRGAHNRPLWSALERLTVDEMIFWVDRFDSLCPIACEWALAQALEDAAGIEVPQRKEFVRTILCELNRLIWLTTYLSGIMKAIGPNSLKEKILILRESVFSLQEELTGGRVLPGAFKLGGTRRILAMGDVGKLKTFVNQWNEQWSQWKNLVGKDPILEDRLRGLLPISKKVIRKLSWWGIVGKAAGYGYDSRIHRPHGAYPFLDVKPPVNTASDGWSRYQVALSEVDLSIDLLNQLLAKIPEQTKEQPQSTKAPVLSDGFYRGTSESAKGPIISSVEVGKKGKVLTVRLFATAQRVWPVLDPLFSGILAEDFHLAFASLGVSGEDGEI